MAGIDPFDPFDSTTWGSRPSHLNNNSLSSSSSHEPISTYEMTVGQYTFDLELHFVDDGLARLMLAPRRIPGKRNGCVILRRI